MKEPELLITYAQNREDVILYAFLKGIKKPGFYVDVGAFHPELDSVTKFFYERGWRGINIEPGRGALDLFKRERPEDINLNVGVSNKQGTLKLREYTNKGLSTFSEKMQSEYAQGSNKDVAKYSDSQVKVTTLYINF